MSVAGASRHLHRQSAYGRSARTAVRGAACFRQHDGPGSLRVVDRRFPAKWAGGEGPGPNLTDRGKTGSKWSIATPTNGVSIGWATAGANRHDCTLWPSTLDSIKDRGLLIEVEYLHLDRGYDMVFQLRPTATRHRSVRHPLIGAIRRGKCADRHHEARQMGRALGVNGRRLMARSS